MNKTSALSPLAGAAKASAIALYAKPSPGYAAKPPHLFWLLIPIE